MAGKTLDISRMDKSAIDAGTVNGKFYALSIGANSHMAMYNTRLYEAAGIKAGENFDPFGWTYDDVARIGKAVKDATGIPGTDDNTADYQNFSDFVAQKGVAMYSPEGEYQVTQEIVEEYWSIWEGIRNAGATPPGAESAGLAGVSDLAQSGVVTGKSATSWVWANQMPDLKKNTKDELGVIAYPGDPSAQWARASMYWSVFKGSKNKDVAVDVINFLNNDLEAVKLLGTDRGLPSNLDLRRVVSDDTTDPAMKQSIAVEAELTQKFGKSPQVPIKGHSKVKSELMQGRRERAVRPGHPRRGRRPVRRGVQVRHRLTPGQARRGAVRGVDHGSRPDPTRPRIRPGPR